MFFFNSALLGVGLAMDAFSVSLANGLNEPKMRKSKMGLIALTFAFFQAAMPLIGFICVHTVVEYFKSFEKFIPWIALILLCYIGGSMLIDGIKNKEGDENIKKLTFATLMMQGVATSIDALSVGFTISKYNVYNAIVCAIIIAIITFGICYAGIILGKKFGTKYSKNAGIFGGAILILIGIEIFITGILGL